MPLAYWRDEYRTGYARIDDQHIHLFKIVNTLHDAMLQGHGRDVLEQTLDELIHYTLEHFQMEEMLMELNQYPWYADHKAKHEALKQDVSQLLAKMKQENRFLSIEVSHFLTSWLIHHIKGEDQKMIKYFRSRSREIAQPEPLSQASPLV